MKKYHLQSAGQESSREQKELSECRAQLVVMLKRRIEELKKEEEENEKKR